jgi:hypothetical protein
MSATTISSVRQAVEQALVLGGSDVGLIRYLLQLDELKDQRSVEEIDVDWLSCYERPQPSLSDYDRLLGSGGEEVIQ